MKSNWKTPALILLSTSLIAGAAQASWFDRDDDDDHCERPNKMMKHGGRGDLNLSIDQIRTLTEARLIMQGNERLKVGEVIEKDENTFTVQIVTVDGSLVREVEVDKNKGPMQKRGYH